MALALGKTVQELLNSLDSEELTEWAAYYRVNPFGTYRGDVRTALVCSTMANIHAPKGKKFTVKDFMLTFDEGEARRLTPDEMIDFVRGFGVKADA